MPPHAVTNSAVSSIVSGRPGPGSQSSANAPPGAVTVAPASPSIVAIPRPAPRVAPGDPGDPSTQRLHIIHSTRRCRLWRGVRARGPSPSIKITARKTVRWSESTARGVSVPRRLGRAPAHRFSTLRTDPVFECIGNPAPRSAWGETPQRPQLMAGLDSRPRVRVPQLRPGRRLGFAAFAPADRLQAGRVICGAVEAGDGPPRRGVGGTNWLMGLTAQAPRGTLERAAEVLRPRAGRMRGRRLGDRNEIMSLWQDLRTAARGLARRPGFTLTAATTLALGIGATVAIFTVVNSVLIQPLPYPQLREDRLRQPPRPRA